MDQIIRTDDHEPTREQQATFQQLALGCASLRVERMTPIGALKYRAVQLATDGATIAAHVVYPDGRSIRQDQARAA